MYLLAGAAIFYYVESKEEYKRASIEKEDRKNIERKYGQVQPPFVVSNGF